MLLWWLGHVTIIHNLFVFLSVCMCGSNSSQTAEGSNSSQTAEGSNSSQTAEGSNSSQTAEGSNSSQTAEGSSRNFQGLIKALPAGPQKSFVQIGGYGCVLDNGCGLVTWSTNHAETWYVDKLYHVCLINKISVKNPYLLTLAN